MKEFENIVSRVFLPNKLVALATREGFIIKNNSIIREIGEQNRYTNEPVAYICENFTCGLPVHDVEQLKQRLSNDLK